MSPVPCPDLTAADLTLDLPHPPRPAQAPPEQAGRTRDDVRMLVIDRRTRTFRHAHFHDLPEFVQPGDLFVVNDSATLPAALAATGRDGPLTLHIAARLANALYIVERRDAAGRPDDTPFAEGERIDLEDAVVWVKRRFHPGSRLWLVSSKADLWSLAQNAGRPIRYAYARQDLSLRDYQTIFARRPGSAEMPSAGRPFSLRVVRAMAARGARFASITLHCGVSSHEVQTRLADHPVIPEWYHIPSATARAVNEAKAAGRRVIAVGTTVVRALESSAVRNGGQVAPECGWTNHLVTPCTPPAIANGLLTGMHDQQSSHLALMLSFVDRRLLTAAYRAALAEDYAWHEFGDTNLIL